jgi:hypothetical protein
MSTLPTNTGTTGTPAITNPLPADPLVGKLTGKEESLANWAGPYVTQMLGQSQALAQSPYQTYQGPLTAGTSTLQNKFFTGLGSLGFPSTLGQSFTGSGTPTLPSASLTGSQQTVGGPTGIASQYMNPYLNAVLQPQLEELRRQAQIGQTGIGSAFAKSGAFGGARQAIQEAELQRNLLQEMNKAIGSGYAGAYGQGLQQFNTEQQQGQQLASMLAGAGQQQRAIEQEGITADLNEFLQQRDYPMRQLQFQQSMLQGLPISAISQQYQQPSGLSNFLGQSSGILALLKQLGIIQN